MAFDLKTAIASHNTFFSGRTALTHRPRNPPGIDNTAAIGHRSAVTKERLSLFGGTIGLENVTCIWEVWGYTQPVNNGDSLFEGATEFIVLDRFFCNQTSRYECACQQV